MHRWICIDGYASTGQVVVLGPTQKLISNSFGARLDLACCTHIDMSSLFELERVGSTLAALYIYSFVSYFSSSNSSF